MRNGEYWQKRMMALEAATHSSAAKAYKTAVTALDDAGILLNKEIDKWIGRIAKNNGISVQEARKWLKGAELKEFQWDLETYIKKGEENAYSHKWVKELENASARAHISRLEAMELEIESVLRDAYGVQETVTGDLLTQVYQDRYYGAAYDIEIGTGNGTMLAGLNESAVRQVISNPWSNDNVNFSSRIWSAMDDMKTELHKQLTRQILTGASPDQAISAMTQYVDAGVKKAKYRAGRLVMTESAAIGNKAQQDCFDALGVKEYVIISTLDGKTCAECGDMDSLHFPMNKFEIGVTAPPFHPMCRCCTAPYFEDDPVSTRMARNPESGKSEYVPNMTYNEWKEKYIDKTESNAKIILAEFRSVDLQHQHYDKHKAEFGNINEDEYLKMARSMATAKASDDVKTLLRSDNSTSKYRRSSNEFIVLNSDGTIRTYFKPLDGEGYWNDEIERNN